MDKWDPFQEFVKLRNLFNELFDRTFQKQVMDDELGLDRWAPQVDVYECDKNVTIEAELPGVQVEEIQIELRDGLLTLRGNRPAPYREGEAVFHRVERLYGPFKREVKVPYTVDDSKIEAEYRSGVLRVVLPRGNVRKVKTIPITPRD